jgi:hypothetical protein
MRVVMIMPTIIVQSKIIMIYLLPCNYYTAQLLADDLHHIFKPTTIHTTFHPACHSFQNQQDAILHVVQTKTNSDQNNLQWKNKT